MQSLNDVILKADNLFYSYDDGNTFPLNGLSLEIRRGKKIAVMGPNGSGKSTLLHILGSVDKPTEGKVVIALDGDKFAGFSYIETWGNKQYVANSGLIVVEKFRGQGLAKRIKRAAFTLSRLRWPHAKLFGLTSGGAVMKINTELGYVPVPFAELTDDDAFWKGCEGCCNHDVLERTGRRYCICTAMLYDPEKHKEDNQTKE